MASLGAIWRGAALAAGALLCLALATSLLAPVWPFADSLAHFRLHLALALVAPALALLLSRRRARRASFLFVAAALAVLHGALPPAYPWLRGGAPGEAPSVTLLTLNLLFRNNDHDAVLALIAAEAPDAIALQEVSRRNKVLLDALRRDYPHQRYCPFAGVGGVAVLSRFAPVGAEASANAGAGPSDGCAEGLGLVWLRVATRDGPLTLASTHLHWPYPYGQKGQIDLLAPRLEALPRPVLLGGDFNAAPWSHAADRIAEASDARVLPGLRFTFHFSYGGRILPIGMPIDHILADPLFAPVSITVGDPVGSDHRAVIARLARR